MHTIRLDKDMNRLIVILKGSFNKSEGEQCVNDIVFSVNQLKRGFDVINDISEFQGSDEKCEDFFLNSFMLLKIKGVRNIIRVVGASKKALLKFATETKLIDNYPVQCVPTMKDAENILMLP